MKTETYFTTLTSCGVFSANHGDPVDNLSYVTGRGERGDYGDDGAGAAGSTRGGGGPGTGAPPRAAVPPLPTPVATGAHPPTQFPAAGPGSMESCLLSVVLPLGFTEGDRLFP